MASQFEKTMLLSLGFMCAWFGLTTMHFFSQISSQDGVAMQMPLSLRGLRKAGNLIHAGNLRDKVGQVTMLHPKQNRVNQIIFTPEKAKDVIEKVPFPLSIKNEDFESIVHPSIAMLPPDKAKNVTEKVEMKVPAFWNPSMFDYDVRKFLGNNGERLITREEADRIGSYTPSRKDYDVKVGDADVEVEYEQEDIKSIRYIVEDMPPDEVLMLETIFVTIASYRDYRCSHTVKALFEQATYPERIRVGIVDQLDIEEDDNCAEPKRNCDHHPHDTLCKYAHQIDVYKMDAALAVGPVFARHIGDRMYRGEYFVMQCDAHMEFVNDWDEDVISQWKSAENEMAVLTTYPSEVEDHYNKKTGTRASKSRPIMCETDFETDYYNEQLAFLMHGQQPEEEPEIEGEPVLHHLWAAGFSFARGHFAVQVPYDQYLPMIFQGEEINIGLRGFTYGYDFYAPEKSVLYHYYHSKKDGKKRKVKRFWEHADAYEGLEAESKSRLLATIEMLGMTEEEAGNSGDGKLKEARENNNEKEEEEYETVPISWNSIDAEKYSVGKARSVKKFLDTFGIDLLEQKVQKHMCRFVRKPMTKIFTKYIRKDGMGIDYNKIDFKFQDPEEFGNTWEKYL